jgi:hypothetical protein
MRTITRESMAWQYLANKLDRQGRMSPFTDSWLSSPGERCSGLCAEIAELREAGVIDRDLAWKMGKRIDDLQQEALDANDRFATDSCYLWPIGRVAPRIVAAQLLALLAKQEERAAARQARKARIAGGLGLERAGEALEAIA